ncbi:MAG: primosomal protein DnaI [Mollicutes bacterium]|nr:primosomal protein DnaI [Mollicutes bacterium]
MKKLNEEIKMPTKVANKRKASRMNVKLTNLIKRIDLTEEEVNNNLTSLEDALEELENCKNCSGLNNCLNNIKGYVYYPQKKGSRVTFDYIACKKLKNHTAELEEKKASTILDNARMKDIDVTDKKRVKLIKWLKDFYDNYDQSKINKGLYLHGSFGSGKTFLLAALLNELKEQKGVRYELIYYPELLRNLKNDFSLVDNKVSYLCNVEILVLDDIGAEKVTEWGRDEILGTILQHRMNNNLTTFFTSNLNINELETRLAAAKDSIDIINASRIIERIKYLTTDMELISVNHRNIRK